MPFASYETPFVSYSQAREDVVLIRALRDVPAEEGFYIDIGAYDANTDSVTRAFYDAGWRGINVEPSPELITSFTKDRPRDINLQFAVSSKAGELTFFENDNGQLGTLEERFASPGSNRRVVPVATLAKICEDYAPDQIHFLKIDVEGHERSVLEGADFSRFRPWILVIEAVRPNTHIPTYHEWEEIVTSSGYSFVLADAINRFYLAEEHQDLVHHFAMVADNFFQYRERWDLEAARARVNDLEEQLESMRRQLQDYSALHFNDAVEIKQTPDSTQTAHNLARQRFERMRALFTRRN